MALSSVILDGSQQEAGVSQMLLIRITGYLLDHLRFTSGKGHLKLFDRPAISLAAFVLDSLKSPEAITLTRTWTSRAKNGLRGLLKFDITRSYLITDTWTLISLIPAFELRRPSDRERKFH
ncbi:hypothetical protein P5673_017163, partial [Acropora cervicornis]